MSEERMEQTTDNGRDKWLVLAEKYFEATISAIEEKELQAFLSSKASNESCFDEIKAVMGFLETGRSIARRGSLKAAESKRTRNIAKSVQWGAIAASIALIAVIGISLLPSTEPKEESDGNRSKDIYYACIDGKEYNDEKFVMQQMLTTMNKMSCSSNDVIETQMEAMFKINN